MNDSTAIPRVTQDPQVSAKLTDARGGFTVIENGIFALGLSPYELAVYAAIVSHASHDTHTAWPSYARLMLVSGVKITMLKSCLKSLQERGLLTVQHGTRPDGGKASNIYTIVPVSKAIDSRVATAPRSHGVHTHRRNTSIPRSPRAHKQDSLNKTHIKEIAPAIAVAAPPSHRNTEKPTDGIDLTPEQLFDELAERNNRRITTNSVAKVLAQPDSKPAKPARANPHFDAIITAFHFDAATMTKTEKGGIGKVAAELNAAGYTPEDIAEIHAYCVRKGFDAFTPHALTAHASAWRASVNGKGAAKSGSMFGEGNWNLHAWDDIDAVGGAK